MAGGSRDLTFRLFGKDETASKTFGEVGGHAEKLSGKAVAAGAALGTALGGGLALAAGAAVGFAKDSVRAASDMNETMSKVKNVFGASSDQVVDWSRTAAKSFGLSQSAALAATGQFGDMFHQLGFTQQASAKTSESMVKMAADLGSFHNVDPSDVLDRIGGALRGEYDSLQQLIPNISAARVEQEALSETHKHAASALTAAEKATAVLAIIQRDGANATNDFAETSNGLANRQRILSATLEDTKAKLGAALLPMMVAVAGFVLNNVVPAFTALWGFLSRNLGPVITQLGGLFGGGGSGLHGRMEAVSGFVSGTLIPVFKAIAGFFTEHVLPAVQKVAQAVGEGLHAAFERVQRAVADNRPELEKIGNVLRVVASFIVDHVLPVLGHLAKFFAETLGVAFSVGVKVIGGVVDGITSIVQIVERAIKLLGDLGGAIKHLPGVGAITGVLKHIPGFASGTRFAPGGLALVGEDGPELVNMPRGASVANNNTLRGMSGGGGGDIHIHVAGNVLDGRQLADIVQTALLQKKNRGGSLGLA